MYISKFVAFNYRSLKKVSIHFKNGKNVLVGKNNSGKSNILKALDILIGEKWPTYQNFSNNDFYTFEGFDKETGEIDEVIAENLYFHVKLEGKDFDKELIKTIKKQTAFSKLKNRNCLFIKDLNENTIPNYDFFQSLDVIEKRDETETLETYNNGKEKKTEWKTAENLITFLENTKANYLFFCKSRLDDEKSGFGLFCITDTDEFWITHFLSKKLRDSLITSTYISALRSHKEDLRVVYYSWFGKLIAKLWENNKSKKPINQVKNYDELIKEQTKEIKSLVDAVFNEDILIIKKILEGAIAYKDVSFKLLNDSKNELYKNVQIFINDGIDRPIYEKGTGIQSAIIIALFSLYCEKFHNKSSLLIAEEPELFLHPHARRVISNELDKYLISENKKERQLIISTHSTEFLKNVDIQNIIRIFKDQENNCSISSQLDNTISRDLTIEIKRFIWSNNTEIFFADKVLLVEGGEVYLIPSIIEKIKKEEKILDYKNISVSRVDGKGNFLTYLKILKQFQINCYILGDLDCFTKEVEDLSDFLNIEEIKPNLKLIKQAINNLPIDYSKIKDRIKKINNNFDAQILKSIFEKFNEGEIEKDDEELLNILKYMKSRFKDGKIFNIIIQTIGAREFIKILNILKANKIFIWRRGELEDYYTKLSKNIEGSKDIKALKISYEIKEKDKNLNDYFNYTNELLKLTNFILN